MEFVKITKAGIEGTPEVAKSSLPQYLGYGWSVVEEPPPPPPTVDEDERTEELPPTGEVVDPPGEPAEAPSRSASRTKEK